MYVLQSASKENFPTLLQIWESSVRATHHFLLEDDIIFFKTFILENNIFEQVDLTVARDIDNKIIGFMGVSSNSLEMLFIDPSIRGKGIGRLLLNYAIDKFKVTKVDVNEQNEDALAFYQHFGFKVISRSELDGTGKPYPILHLGLAQ